MTIYEVVVRKTVVMETVVRVTAHTAAQARTFAVDEAADAGEANVSTSSTGWRAVTATAV